MSSVSNLLLGAWLLLHYGHVRAWGGLFGFGPVAGFHLGGGNLGHFGKLGYGHLGGLTMGRIGNLHYGNIGGISGSVLGAANPNAMEDDPPTNDPRMESGGAMLGQPQYANAYGVPDGGYPQQYYGSPSMPLYEGPPPQVYPEPIAYGYRPMSYDGGAHQQEHQYAQPIYSPPAPHQHYEQPGDYNPPAQYQPHEQPAHPQY